MVYSVEEISVGLPVYWSDSVSSTLPSALDNSSIFIVASIEHKWVSMADHYLQKLYNLLNTFVYHEMTHNVSIIAEYLNITSALV